MTSMSNIDQVVAQHNALVKERLCMNQFCKCIRDKRRVQYTMLTFLYAYERRLSLGMKSLYTRSCFKAVNCTESFYRLYNFITAEGDVFEYTTLAGCGKKLLTKVFGDIKENPHKTTEELSCINYFYIAKLGIDFASSIKKLDVRKNTPFVDIDIATVLRTKWHIDFSKLYKNIDRAVAENREKNKCVKKMYSVPICYDDIVEIITNSKMTDRPAADRQVIDKMQETKCTETVGEDATQKSDSVLEKCCQLFQRSPKVSVAVSINVNRYVARMAMKKEEKKADVKAVADTISTQSSHNIINQIHNGFCVSSK